MDVGTVTQSNFNLNITNEQQLEDMNEWLARLSESIVSNQMPQESVIDPATSFAYDQMSNFNPPQQTDYHGQYPIVVPSQNNMYPASCEENDMYIRSQPMAQPIVRSQNMNEVSSDYLGLSNQIEYQQQAVYNQPNVGLTGQRQHYTAIPNVSNQYFQPELRTAVNFTKANNPNNAEVEKEEAVSFKPIKSVTHDDKKNMATLVNTFSSALVDNKKPVQAKKELSEEEKQKKEPKADDLIRELITSDLSKLSLNHNGDDDDDGSETKETKFVSSLSSIADSSLYPTTSPEKPSLALNKHLLLLKKMQEWVNENYRKRHPVSTEPNSNNHTSSESVLCQ